MRFRLGYCLEGPVVIVLLWSMCFAVQVQCCSVVLVACLRLMMCYETRAIWALVVAT